MNEYGNGNGSRLGETIRTNGVGQAIYRLSLQEECGANVVDTKALKVADILRGCEKDSKQATRNSVREQSLQLLLYLGSEGNWDISRYGNHIQPLLDDEKKGVEGDVYLWNDDGKYKVIKVIKWWIRHQTPLEFVENKIIAHNAIFPQTAYKLIGIRYEGGEFLFILEQAYVGSFEDVYSSQQEIDEDMKMRGFDKCGSAYSSEKYLISDLNSKNVLKGIDGELYYIDPVIYPNITK